MVPQILGLRRDKAIVGMLKHNNEVSIHCQFSTSSSSESIRWQSAEIRDTDIGNAIGP